MPGSVEGLEQEHQERQDQDDDDADRADEDATAPDRLRPRPARERAVRWQWRLSRGARLRPVRGGAPRWLAVESGRGLGPWGLRGGFRRRLRGRRWRRRLRRL